MVSVTLLVLRLFRFAIDFFIKPVLGLGYKLYYRNIDKRNPLPKFKNEYLLMPANQLALKIRSKKISSLKLVTLYIERIKEIQPFLNCVVKTCYDSAIQEAINVDKLLESIETLPEKYSVEKMPLLGVPFSCKESIWVKDMPNTTGIIARKDFKAPKDADVVKYMRESGAILTCLTNTSEGCMWFESSNYLYGTSRNPYNLSRIVGGSSGGEACIISGGGSIMGIGSDIGGSIRMPAYFNGVYGHKPSSSFISNKTQHPPASGISEYMLVTGPICRYASDLRLLFKIFAGPRYKEVAGNFEADLDFKKLKFFFIKNLQGNLLVSEMSQDSKDALNRAISFVEKSFNVKVKELKPKKLRQSMQIWTSMISNGESRTQNFTNVISDYNEKKVNPIKELFKSVIGFQNKHTIPALGLSITEQVPKQGVQHYIQKGTELREELEQILDSNGVLLFPSFPTVAPYHNQPFFTNTFDYLHYGIINSLGFPSTQCPMGLNKEGLPTGVQIVANNKMDHLTIKLAEYFETNLVGWTPPF